MREIKFRGKRVDNGKWVYGNYATSKDCVYDNIIHLILSQGSTSYGVKFDKVEVIPETVGQYTGLKDKNGVDIYENDIVKLNEYDNVSGVVEFFKGRFFINGFSWNHDSSEVIGNIHDK